MKKFGSFFKGIVTHGKTSVTGVGAAALAAYALYNNPALLASPETAAPLIGVIINGVGGIFSADASKVATTPAAPPVK